MIGNRVNQSGARAGKKVVGRDDNSVNIVSKEGLHVKALVAKLDAEMENRELKNELIESLQFFDEPYTPDGVKGLDAKLEVSGRIEKLHLATRHKELFAKFLSKYSLYGAAQELLALCLHRVHQEFEDRIHPYCDDLSANDIDQIIMREIVHCIVDEYGLGTFALNHGVVQGMVYWLAERCYIRWHTMT